jgi:hypothetical protein
MTSAFTSRSVVGTAAIARRSSDLSNASTVALGAAIASLRSKEPKRAIFDERLTCSSI